MDPGRALITSSSTHVSARHRQDSEIWHILDNPEIIVQEILNDFVYISKSTAAIKSLAWIWVGQVLNADDALHLDSIICCIGWPLRLMLDGPQSTKYLACAGKYAGHSIPRHQHY